MIEAILNLPVLLLASLLLTAAVTYVLRAWERITAYFGAIVAGGWALWLWRTDFNQPLREVMSYGLRVDSTATVERMGFTLRLEPGALPIVVASFALVAVAFLLTAAISQGRSFVSFALILLAGYVSLALMTTGPLAPPILAPLFLVGLSAVGVFVLQAGRPISPVGPIRSLIPPILVLPLFFASAWYLEQMPLNPQDSRPAFIAAQLLALGLILLLAPAPFHGAHPAVAQAAPPVVSALLTLLYQLAVLHLLYRTITTFTFVPTDSSLGTWLTWAGMATAVWGGIAAAGTENPGRLWGYAALHDWGLLILILAVPGTHSWPLVLFLFGLRVVSMLTAAVGLSALEEHTGSLHVDSFWGVGSRMPWSSAAFLLGGFGLAGFPLSAGFTGHWSALQIVAEGDWRIAGVVLIASSGAILGFIRLARVMYGPLANRYLLREKPLSVVVAIVALTLSIGLAIAPQMLDVPIGRALQAFSG